MRGVASHRRPSGERLLRRVEDEGRTRPGDPAAAGERSAERALWSPAPVRQRTLRPATATAARQLFAATPHGQNPPRWPGADALRLTVRCDNGPARRPESAPSAARGQHRAQLSSAEGAERDEKTRVPSRVSMACITSIHPYMLHGADNSHSLELISSIRASGYPRDHGWPLKSLMPRGCQAHANLGPQEHACTKGPPRSLPARPLGFAASIGWGSGRRPVPERPAKLRLRLYVRCGFQQEPWPLVMAEIPPVRRFGPAPRER